MPRGANQEIMIMIITAKFASRCPNCSRSIVAGSRVEWSKGSPARHVDCGQAPAASPRVRQPRKATLRRPAFPSSAPEPGAVMIEGRRNGRGDHRYEIGATIHAPRVSKPGGGPDGRYYTILSAALYPPNEDNQQFDWHECAWVRPATDAEVAPLILRSQRVAAGKLAIAFAALGAAIAEQAAKGILETLCSVEATRPGALSGATSERISGDASRSISRWTLADGTICYTQDWAGYDDYRQTLYGSHEVCARLAYEGATVHEPAVTLADTMQVAS